ncbi:MAG: hypothetical protein L3K26_14190, partial [Candidatus Hydrogenedentes bacterium]|nr:hypothetical protein [Candidatus Hydrogenedentota bacterium]
MLGGKHVLVDSAGNSNARACPGGGGLAFVLKQSRPTQKPRGHAAALENAPAPLAQWMTQRAADYHEVSMRRYVPDAHLMHPILA